MMRRKKRLSIKEKVKVERIYKKDIFTQIVPFSKFYKEEDYHQEYYEKIQIEPIVKLLLIQKLKDFSKNTVRV